MVGMAPLGASIDVSAWPPETRSARVEITLMRGAVAAPAGAANASTAPASASAPVTVLSYTSSPRLGEPRRNRRACEPGALCARGSKLPWRALWQPHNMATIQTLGGPLDTGELGTVLMHEHIFNITAEIQIAHPGFNGWDPEVEIPK